MAPVSGRCLWWQGTKREIIVMRQDKGPSHKHDRENGAVDTRNKSEQLK